MLKKPFFLAPSAGIFELGYKSAHQYMMDVGLNTGNMLFAQAAQTILGPLTGIKSGALMI